MKANDLFATITDQLVADIEAGAGTWRMPWHTLADAGTPTSVDGRPYRGVNAVWLPMVSAARGWTSGVWATYRGWQRHGAQVRRGERGTHVILWKPTVPVSITERYAVTCEDRCPAALLLVGDDGQCCRARPAGLSLGCRGGRGVARRPLALERPDLFRPVLARLGVDPIDPHNPPAALLADSRVARLLPAHGFSPTLTRSPRNRRGDTSLIHGGQSDRAAGCQPEPWEGISPGQRL